MLFVCVVLLCAGSNGVGSPSRLMPVAYHSAGRYGPRRIPETTSRESFIERQDGASVITLNNLASGEETTIHRLPANSFATDLIAPPRGDVVAYGVASSTGFKLEVVDLVAPYKTREILSGSSSPAHVAFPVAWSGNDRELIVRRWSDEKGQRFLPSREPSGRSTLWILDLNTGKMRLLPTPLGELLGARVSPNGERIALETGVLPLSEVWTIENALAALPR